MSEEFEKEIQNNPLCKSSWIFIKIIHEKRIEMLDMDDVVRPLKEFIVPLVEIILDNHSIEFIKVDVNSNLINQKEGDCED